MNKQHVRNGRLGKERREARAGLAVDTPLRIQQWVWDDNLHTSGHWERL